MLPAMSESERSTESPKEAAPAAAETPEQAIDREVREKLTALDAEVDAGRVTMLTYNERRKALVTDARERKAKLQAAAPPPPGPDEPKADAKLDGSADAKRPEDKPSVPGWAQPKAMKHWSAGGRGDDPTVRKVHAPLGNGIGDGKAFFFLFGLRTASDNDQRFLAAEMEHIGDDIEVLRKNGYTVVVDPQGTREDFLGAVSGQGEGAAGLTPAGIYWSAHGAPDGSVLTCDGGELAPRDLDPNRVSKDLRLVIFGSCYVGSRVRTWRQALGGHPLVVGWGRPVTIDRVVQFLDPDPECTTGLGDLIARYIVGDAPIPGETPERYSPLADAALQGRVGNLADRVRAVAEKLDARWREQPKWLDIEVPLEDDRTRVCEVFIVDSAEPFSEGEPLLAVEADVGEWSGVVEPQLLFGAQSAPGYARVALVKGETDVPRIVTQGFLPLARVRDQDLAALVHQVAASADDLARRIFG